MPGSSHGFAPGQVHAYLATRGPATFAAIRRVLAEVALSRPGWAPTSVLDLGAGPGTATWAAVSVFPSIESAQLVEREPEMAALGARLAARGLTGLLPGAVWTNADAAVATGPMSDLVVAAYFLGELGDERERTALERWWGATRGELVLVEPGTPAGFERLRAARSSLISFGAHVTAPCPHDGRCPMVGPDWCHFAVRLERSALQRELKGHGSGTRTRSTRTSPSRRGGSLRLWPGWCARRARTKVTCGSFCARKAASANASSAGATARSTGAPAPPDGATAWI